MSTEEKLSPMYQQYLDIKKEYPEGFLFYRMGDFYELFFEDAVKVAKELQLTLTTRNKTTDIPMAGVPFHALEPYAAQLIEKGYTLVICEQIEDPKTAKGLVKRAVTRIITPGTIIESTNLEAKEHNYLGAYFYNPKNSIYAFAWLDVSTGDWSGFETNKEAEISQWVLKIRPSELLIADNHPVPDFIKSAEGIKRTYLPQKSHFDKAKSLEIIKRVLSIQDLESVGLNNFQDLLCSCGALLTYLEQTQKQTVNYIKNFKPLQFKNYMIIDEVTEQNLELFTRTDGKKGIGTLIHAIDQTLTPAGGRLLVENIKKPYSEKEKIEKQQELTSFFVENNEIRNSLREELDNFCDIERLSTKLHLNRAFPKDVKILGNTLAHLPKIYNSFFKNINIDNQLKALTTDEAMHIFPNTLRSILKSWDILEDIALLIDKAILEEPANTVTEGCIFKKGYNADLDHYIRLIEDSETLLENALNKEQVNCNLPKLKIGYNRVFGYFYELTKLNIPTDLPSHFERKQTLGNAERYTTEELKKLEVEILSASEVRKSLEYKLFNEVRDVICQARDRLIFMADIIAGLDCSQSYAEIACKNNWVCPKISNTNNLRITDGRHPVIEPLIGKTNFVPNNINFDIEKRLILITGPNMAGKSTILRQNALIVLLAQMGAYVPALFAEIGITDRIFSRVGASDNLARGQSTFMVEMMETARILRQSTKRSLIILDEIGRGTSTYDGLSLAWAIIEDLTKKENSPRTLFATHYHELTSLEGNQKGVFTMNVAIREWQGEIVFIRKLIPGPSDKSYGIEVAKLAGVPSNVVQRAKQILKCLENEKVYDTKESVKSIQQEELTFPEIELPKKNEIEEFNIPSPKDQEHPLIEILYDIKPEELSPMQALSMINEWKELWGKK